MIIAMIMLEAPPCYQGIYSCCTTMALQLEVLRIHYLQTLAPRALLACGGQQEPASSVSTARALGPVRVQPMCPGVALTTPF